MPVSLRTILTTVLVCGLTFAGIWLPHSDPRIRVATRVSTVALPTVRCPQVGQRDCPRRAVSWFPAPDWQGIVNYTQAIATDRQWKAIAQVGAYLSTQSPPSPREQSGPSLSGQRQPAGGGGPITQEQFAALNVCEAGGENGWRTGRYGLELGYPIGDWSIEAQQAKAQEIFDRAGPHAWGPLCAPILGG